MAINRDEILDAIKAFVISWIDEKIAGLSWTFLTTPLKSTSWDGDARSTTAKTVIDLSSVFGVPAGVKAVIVRIYARDSGSAGATSYWFGVGANDSSGIVSLAVRPAGITADTLVENSGVVPCNTDGDIYFQCVASGSGTMDAWLEIWGYYQ